MIWIVPLKNQINILINILIKKIINANKVTEEIINSNNANEKITNGNNANNNSTNTIKKSSITIRLRRPHVIY